MSTAREIVRRTLEYAQPERVARSFPPESDFVRTAYTTETAATDWHLVDGRRWERTDEWGNLWVRVEGSSKGEVARGVLDNLDRLDDYTFPDFSRPEDYAEVRAAREANPDHWLIGNMPGFTFNIARKMRRIDNYLTDILADPERIQALHDRIDVMLEAMIRNYAAAGVDAVMFPEDWGTQTQTLVNPEVWHAEFYPRFERLCGVAHERGIKVFMHSCGKIGAIIPGLIKAGVDLLQFDQPDLHGIDTLAGYQDRFGITFWSPVDIQQTLPTGDETRIRAKAREMLDKLWRGRGGFVAGYYGDTTSIGIDPVWQAYASDEFLNYGRREAA